MVSAAQQELKYQCAILILNPKHGTVTATRKKIHFILARTRTLCHSGIETGKWEGRNSTCYILSQMCALKLKHYIPLTTMTRFPFSLVVCMPSATTDTLMQVFEFAFTNHLRKYLFFNIRTFKALGFPRRKKGTASPFSFF